MNPEEPQMDRGKKSLIGRLWPLLLFVAAIFVSSSTVITPKQFVHAVSRYSPIKLSEQEFSQFWSAWWWLFVKGWHFTQFGIVFLALRYVLGGKRVWLAIIISCLLAASDEIHQLSVPGRGGHVSDWLIDVLGIAVVWAFVHFKAAPSKIKWPLYLALVVASLFIVRLLALNPF